MKNLILTLVLTLVLLVSSFGVVNTVNASVSSDNVTVTGDQYTYVRVNIGGIWHVYVYNGPELVNVIIEAQE